MAGVNVWKHLPMIWVLLVSSFVGRRMALENMQLIQMPVEAYATATRFMVAEISRLLDTRQRKSVRQMATDQHGVAFGSRNGATILKLAGGFKYLFVFSPPKLGGK